MTQLGPRPAPEFISFDRECFHEVGTRKFWTLRNPTGFGYPKRFDTKEAAEAAHKKLPTHILGEETETVSERIRWN